MRTINPLGWTWMHSSSHRSAPEQQDRGVQEASTWVPKEMPMRMEMLVLIPTATVAL